MTNLVSLLEARFNTTFKLHTALPLTTPSCCALTNKPSGCEFWLRGENSSCLMQVKGAEGKSKRDMKRPTSEWLIMITIHVTGLWPLTDLTWWIPAAVAIQERQIPLKAQLLLEYKPDYEKSSKCQEFPKKKSK